MKFRTLTCSTVMTLFVGLGLAGNAGAQTFTSLFSFDSKNGEGPEAGLVQATMDGDLYGTTTFGGTNHSGKIFAISPSGVLIGLYNFCSQSDCADGWEPAATLVQDTNGNLYGTTTYGGASSSSCNVSGGCGTVSRSPRVAR